MVVMNELNIIKNNDLIAEFIGWEIVFKDGFGTLYKSVGLASLQNGQSKCWSPYLEFHKNWNWLIPVVQKIYKLEDESGISVDRVVDTLCILDITSLYENIVDWIIQYNNDKEKENISSE